MHGDYLIIVLAGSTIAIAGLVAVWQRARGARLKKDPSRSSFTENHGGAPRQNRPGTEH